MKLKIHPNLKDQDKDKLLIFIEKTKKTIPLLTNEKLLENETKNKIKELTNRITWLTEDFQKIRLSTNKKY